MAEQDKLTRAIENMVKVIQAAKGTGKAEEGEELKPETRDKDEQAQSPQE